MRSTIASHLPRFVRRLVLALALFGAAFASSAAVFVSVNFAPPPLPVYAQPLCPGPGYIWAPGYWAWGPDGYYWVPGTWVLAPFIGALWTPGYWGFDGAVYVWHPGYWGTHVGYYGGIDYGFGYFGAGYVGGYWSGRSFHYNTSVNRVDVSRVHYTYNRAVQNVHASRVSYNGGPGGTNARPSAQERIAEHEGHRSATPMQVQHERSASRDRALLASVNHGSPQVAATPRLGTFARPESRGRTAGVNESRNAPSQVARAPRTEAERASPSRRGPEFAAETARNSAVERERTAPRAAAPRMESRPEMHAQERTHPQAAPRMETRPARPEMHAQERARPQAAPHRQAPEMHAQNTPHPQAAPHPQPAPRSEMHAQGQPHQGGHEEHRGG